MKTIIIEINDDEMELLNRQIENRIGTAVKNALPDAVVMHLEVADGDMTKAFGIARLA